MVRSLDNFAIVPSMRAVNEIEKGEPVSGSKFFEAHFRDGKLVKVGNQFGVGRN